MPKKRTAIQMKIDDFIIVKSMRTIIHTALASNKKLNKFQVCMQYLYVQKWRKNCFGNPLSFFFRLKGCSQLAHIKISTAHFTLIFTLIYNQLNATLFLQIPINTTFEYYINIFPVLSRFFYWFFAARLLEEAGIQIIGLSAIIATTVKAAALISIAANNTFLSTNCYANVNNAFQIQGLRFGIQETGAIDNTLGVTLQIISGIKSWLVSGSTQSSQCFAGNVKFSRTSFAGSS